MSEDLVIQNLRALMDTQGTARSAELRPVRPSASPRVGEGEAGVEAPSFSDALKQSLIEVNALKIEADKAAQGLAAGQTDDIQGAILAMEKADISFRLMMEIRNKLLSAYQEVIRTQI